jgi:hypothetical protein
MERKYQKYKINVQYLNGDIEDINMAGINTSSYSKMLEVYHRIKNTYADKVKIINFIGIDQEGNMHIKFTKEIKHKGRDDLKQDINEILDNISKEILLIKEKNFYHHGLIDALNKKEDLKLHELESLDKVKFNNEADEDKEILRIGKELKNIRIERRWHKDQFSLISKLGEQRIGNESVNFTHLSNVFKPRLSKQVIKPLNMKVAEELKLYKEEPIKDKEKQVNNLQKYFEKVIVDEADNRLIAYNKAKAI